MMKLPRYHIMFGHVCLALAWSTTASITTTLASTITTLAIAAERIIYFFSRSTTMATTLTKSLHAPKPSHAKPERLWRWSQLKLWFHHWHNADYTTTILVTMITTATTPLRCSMLPLQTNFFVWILSAKGQRNMWKGGKEARSKGMKESPVAAHGLFLKASKQTGRPPPRPCLIRIISAFSDLFQTVSDCLFKGLQPQETNFFYYDHYFFFY